MSSSRDLHISVLFGATDKLSGPLKAIKRESAKARSEISDTAKALLALEKAQADVGGFRDLKRGLQDTRRALTAAEEKATRLGRALSETEKPTRRMRTEFNAAVRAADQLNEKLQQQHRALGETRDRLSAAGVSTKDLAAHERRLRTEIEATNAKLKAQRNNLQNLNDTAPQRLADLRETEARLDRHADRIRQGAGIVGAALTAVSTAVGVEAVKQAASFESSMTDIAQKANLSREQAQRMGTILLAIAPKIAQMPEDAAAAVDTLAGKGLFNRFNDIDDPVKKFRAIEEMTRNMVDPIGKAATAYKADMNDLSAASFAAVQNLQVPVEQTRRVLDTMAAADNAGSFSMRDMAAEFPALTGAARALGQTGIAAVADLSTALEIAATTAGSSAEAANNVLNLLNKINAKETTDNFKKMGVDLPKALNEAYRKGKTPLEAISELTNKTLKGDLSKLSHLFGDAQVQAALRPLIQNLDEYRKMRDQVTRSEGTVERAFVDRERDTASKWKRLQAAWSTRMTEVGKRLSPVVDPLIEAATRQLEKTPQQAAAEHAAQAAQAAKWRAGMLKDLTGAARAVMPAPAAAALAVGLDRLNKARGDAKQAEGEIAKSKARTGQLIAAIRADAQRVRPEFVTIGSNMALGLAVGIERRWPGLVARAQQLARSIRDAFKGALKIKSPSRVFTDLGLDVTQGLLVGLDRGAPAPVRRMRVIADDLSAALAAGAAAVPAAPALAVSGGAGGGTGSVAAARAPAPITINIYPQPGQSAEDIARAVRDELDRRDRADAAASRSAYRDDD